MSSTRGRVIRQGGVQTDDGATARTQGMPQAPITRPAYRVANGQMQPVGVAGTGGPSGHSLLDLTTVAGWRTVWVLAAAAYLGFWFVSISGGRIAGGVRL